MPDERIPFDLDAYTREVQAGECWLCRVAAHDPDYPRHYIIHESGEAIAFLNRYPTVRGAVIVAPKTHREAVIQDFPLQEYLTLQRLVWRVGRALQAVLKPERVYVASLGSPQLTAHVHWRVIPVPPGIPLEEQQAALLDLRGGYLPLDEAEARVLATDLNMMLLAM